MWDEKVVAAGLLDALEASDRELRERLPAVFRRVDRIKGRPDWQPFQTHWSAIVLNFDRLAWLECRRCGDNFVSKLDPRRKGPPEFCSPECKLADRRFRRRRGIAA